MVGKVKFKQELDELTIFASKGEVVKLEYADDSLKWVGGNIGGAGEQIDRGLIMRRAGRHVVSGWTRRGLKQRALWVVPFIVRRVVYKIGIG